MINSPDSTPFFSAPVRWALRVLAWLAFSVAAYLAWHAVTGSSVAACGMGDANSCDEVLASSWAKWIGIPVAVLGLACYATLATLSVLLGMANTQVSRWINTVFVLLSIVAAGASLWFIGLQMFMIGKFCLFCMVTDLCGLAIGGLAIWSLVKWFIVAAPIHRTHSSAAGLAALRTAIPTASAPRHAPVAAPRTAPITAPQGVPIAVSRSAPIVAPRTDSTFALATTPEPFLPVALGGAVAMLVLLIVGQVVFRAPTYTTHSGALKDPIALVGADESATTAAEPSVDPAAGQSHTAMRIPSEPATPADNSETSSTASDRQAADDAIFSPKPDDPAAAAANTSANGQSNGSLADRPADMSRERILTFLNGSLKIDTYKHPIIGSPEAPKVMIEMVSYDCPHCREMHRIVKRGLSRYGNQIAIIVMPIPMESRCNRLITDPKASHKGACSVARMALGVAAVRPSQFERFHDWLMADKEKPPREDMAIAKAYEMVDRPKLRTLSRGEELNKQLSEYVELYARLANQYQAAEGFGLPVQIFGDILMAGKAESDKEIFDGWEKHLGVTPR